MEDTGFGVKPENQDKLFTLFGKLDSTKKLNTKGIGLGLNICKKIVQACGGEIHYDKAYKDGACFEFDIQCRDPNFVDHPASSEEILFIRHDALSTSNPPFNLDTLRTLSNDSILEDDGLMPYKNLKESQKKLMKKLDVCSCTKLSKILIVDDNIFNIVTIQTMLDIQFGVKSDKASNGQEALAMVAQRLQPCRCGSLSQYELIFMDLQMPQMNGFETSAHIRRFDGLDQERL